MISKVEVKIVVPEKTRVKTAGAMSMRLLRLGARAFKHSPGRSCSGTGETWIMTIEHVIYVPPSIN